MDTPPSLEKDLMDLERVRAMLAGGLANYEEAQAKIKAKWAKKAAEQVNGGVTADGSKPR